MWYGDQKQRPIFKLNCAGISIITIIFSQLGSTVTDIWVELHDVIIVSVSVVPSFASYKKYFFQFEQFVIFASPEDALNFVSEMKWDATWIYTCENMSQDQKNRAHYEFLPPDQIVNKKYNSNWRITLKEI